MKWLTLSTAVVTELLGGWTPPASATPPKTVHVSDLDGPVHIIRDADGIPHVLAKTEHDMVFAVGWVHTEDRLFQLDTNRRLASGTLAELVGASGLTSDRLMRPLGLRRAAEASFAAMSSEAQAALQAYADGVNAYLKRYPLPPEYASAEITKVAPWTPLDSIVIGKGLALLLSFELDIERTQTLMTYRRVGAALCAASNPQCFDGTALFFEDLFRAAPFDAATTVSDSGGPRTRGGGHSDDDDDDDDDDDIDDHDDDGHPGRLVAGLSRAAPPGAAASMSDSGRSQSRSHRGDSWHQGRSSLSSEGARLAESFLSRAKRVPLLSSAVDRAKDFSGSNEWAVAGWRARGGRPLIANDPHLSLSNPSNFYPMGLHAKRDGFSAVGGSIPGTPYIVQGQNRRIAWGTTTSRLDVTDVYQEVIKRDPASPSGFRIVHREPNDALDRIVSIPEVFRVNVRGDGVTNNLKVMPPGGLIPAETRIIPRRNHGPIVSFSFNPATGEGTALSIAYTGWSGTREIEAFRRINLARNVRQFVRALQLFDVGSQNFIYGDIRGNIGFFSSAEAPLREDLEAGKVEGLPPMFIRKGTGGNDWIHQPERHETQAVPFKILPYAEMPQVLNPKNGFVVNANNDPLGLTLDNNPLNELRPSGGILYLSADYATGTRAGRITRALRQRFRRGRVRFEDMQHIQADTVLLDAEFFTPFILGAHQNATQGGAPAALAAYAADVRVAEAVRRLRAWNYTTPTGIPEGYDVTDIAGHRLPPTKGEVEHSVAATLYAVWRGQIIKNTIDAALGRASAASGQRLPRPGSNRTIAALRHLFGEFATQRGFGSSGLDFFVTQGATRREDARDILILRSLSDALDRLAGTAFAAAFGGSARQADYRWGRLHRVVLKSLIGKPYNFPSKLAGFPPPLRDLDGYPTDGGFGVVDASSHSVRADHAGAFLFAGGPNRRYVARMGRRRIRAESSLPGGVSGVLGNPRYGNLLLRWLTNDTFPVRHRRSAIRRQASARLVLRP